MILAVVIYSIFKRFYAYLFNLVAPPIFFHFFKLHADECCCLNQLDLFFPEKQCSVYMMCHVCCVFSKLSNALLTNDPILLY